MPTFELTFKFYRNSRLSEIILLDGSNQTTNVGFLVTLCCWYDVEDECETKRDMCGTKWD